MRVPIGISNRHIHLSKMDAEKLFGAGYEFTKIKDLSQPGRFACQEVVSLKGPKGQIDNVRILGPFRKDTQVEILLGDNYVLGIKAPIKMSGDFKNSEPITLVGPKGSVYIQKGVIVAHRHIHMSVAQAKDFGFKNNQIVNVKTRGERAIVFENVKIKTNDSFDFDFHIDIEEANATGVKPGDRGEIL